jgi:beta-barrel assembly-enhancing protease
LNLDQRALHEGPFEGGAFHPDLPGGRASGFVSVTYEGVQFRSEKGSFKLPLDGLKLELGGANDRLVFLSHPSQPKATIHTADHGVLEHPVVVQTPALAAQRGQARTKKRVSALVLLSVACAFLGAIVLLALSKDRLVSIVASGVPVEWEVKAGEKLFEQVVAGKRLIKDPALLAQLKLITDPLVAGVDDQRYPLKFHIVEDPTLNAFAVPGGNAVVHTGLLLAADTPEEVAGVLAHEIAHVTRRHSIRNIISSSGLYLVVSFLFGDMTGLLGVLAENSAFLIDRKFTRDFERDADETGWGYLVRGDIEPRGMITFFKKMQEEEKKLLEKSPIGGIGSALAVLSTHPATDERIATLEAKWKKTAKQSGYRTLPIDYAAFKQSLRAQLHSPSPEKTNP